MERKGVGMKPSVVRALVIGAISLTLCAGARARQVVIDLSEQRVFLLEGGQVLLCAPIASGKDGWRTPTGRFRIRAKDLNHRSGSFGLIEDSNGRVVNANATPGTRVPPGDHYQPAPMPYFMEFAPFVGLHAGYLPGYPASHGCVRMPHDLAAELFTQVSVGTPVTVVGSTQRLSHVRKALPVRPWPTVRYASGWQYASASR
jgi:lipoprotein-anchoring transpeptidase ErfK/SrfK